MPQGIFKILIFTVMIMSAAVAQAQDNLAVGAVFEKYGMRKGCKMVTLVDGKLKGRQLKLYKSLTYRAYGSEIVGMLKADRKRARKITEVVVDGCVESGFYVFPPRDGGLNRYMLYRRVSDKAGAVIYIEAYLPPDEIRKICRR